MPSTVYSHINPNTEPYHDGMTRPHLHLTGMDESFMKPEECRHPNSGLKPVDNSSIVIGVFLCVGLMVRAPKFELPFFACHAWRLANRNKDVLQWIAFYCAQAR
jgi:hypothetical protein